jgi:hypothetical protein
MESWLYDIAKSYLDETPAPRWDSKKHYTQLDKEQKFDLLSENTFKYLDEQLKTAYGFGVSDLKEEELHKILESLFRKIETKEDEKSKKQDYKKSINDIYEKAKQESRALTDEEKTEIEKLKMQFSS